MTTRIAALVIWLAMLYEGADLVGPPLTAPAASFSAAVAVAVIVVRPLRRLAFLWQTALVFPTGFVFFLLTNQENSGNDWAIAGMAVLPTAVTLSLASTVGRLVEEFQRGVVELMIRQQSDGAHRFSDGQSAMYREVCRARHSDHSLVMLAAAPSRPIEPAELNQLIADVQRREIHKYVEARVAQLLADHSRDVDIIAQHDGLFFVLLPQITRQQAQRLADQLRERFLDLLGFELDVGLASFPDDEITLSKLLDSAVADMFDTEKDDPRDDPSTFESGSTSKHAARFHGTKSRI